MAHQVLLLCLIIVNAYVSVAMESTTSYTISSTPLPSPYKAEAPVIRKMGNHQYVPAASSPVSNEESSKEAQAPEAEITEDNVSILEQQIHLKKHRNVDKSIAGGGVILGGLATTFLVAVFCYIRATARHKKTAEINTSSPVSSV